MEGLPEYGSRSARIGEHVNVVAFFGELDNHVLRKVASALEAVVRRDAPRLAIDLRGVEFLDSSVLGLFVQILRQVRINGGELVVVADDPRILRPFGLLGFDRVFTILPKLTEALDLLEAAEDHAETSAPRTLVGVSST